MFSLRQVVENLPAVPGADNALSHGSRPSTPLSSSQSSLRKSLAAQRGRSASPAPRSSSTGKKLSLEDRLKPPKDTLVQANDVTQNHAREPGDITQTSGSETNLNAAHGSANQDPPTDLESLQEQLKQVEQRFLGMVHLLYV